MGKWRNFIVEHPTDSEQEFEDFVALIVAKTNFTDQEVRDYLAAHEANEAMGPTVRDWLEANPTLKAVLANDAQTIVNYIRDTATLEQLRELIALSTLVTKHYYNHQIDPPSEPEITEVILVEPPLVTGE